MIENVGKLNSTLLEMYCYFSRKLENSIGTKKLDKHNNKMDYLLDNRLNT
jgi:hypothetical protein